MGLRRNPHTGRKVAIGSALAGAAGYLAGILTAPKAGKETRQDVAAKAAEAGSETVDQLQGLESELKEVIKTTKVKTVAMSSSARTEFNEAVVKAKDAQNKAAQVIKAAKKGEASDPDLNKAAKQARQALKNLSKFLKS
jgi:gas vesicle protein